MLGRLLRRPGFDRLSLALCQVVFDAGVNCGTACARAWLATAAAHEREADQIRGITAANLAYYRRLKTWPRYGAGWTARIEACETRALALLTAAPVPIPSRAKPPTTDAVPPVPHAAAEPVADPITLFFRGLFASLWPAPHLQGA